MHCLYALSVCTDIAVNCLRSWGSLRKYKWPLDLVATKSSQTRTVCVQVRILEAFMDFSPPAATVFREIGGLSDMIDRLKLEVQAAPAATEAAETGSSVEAMQTDAPGSSAPAAASSPAGVARFSHDNQL